MIETIRNLIYSKIFTGYSSKIFLIKNIKGHFISKFFNCNLQIFYEKLIEDIFNQVYTKYDPIWSSKFGAKLKKLKASGDAI